MGLRAATFNVYDVGVYYTHILPNEWNMYLLTFRNDLDLWEQCIPFRTPNMEQLKGLKALTIWVEPLKMTKVGSHGSKYLQSWSLGDNYKSNMNLPKHGASFSPFYYWCLAPTSSTATRPFASVESVDEVLNAQQHFEYIL